MTTTKKTALQKIEEGAYEKLVAEFGEIPEPVESNQEEQRQEERRDRFLNRAETAARRSGTAWQASHDATSGIPAGQPIMVGHHSEGAHRRAIGRSNSSMRVCVDEQEKAKYYAGRAASVGNAGISSTDPDAVRKLMLKLLGLQITQERMKAANSVIRSKSKKKYPDQAAKILALVGLGFSEAEAKKLFEPDFCARVGFPSYKLSNNGSNMKRIQERIKELGSLTEIEDEEYSLFDGWLGVEINQHEGRVCLRNGSKPSKGVRDIYGRNGFNWSPTNEVWSRKLTRNAIGSIKTIEQALSELGQDNF